MHATLLGTIIKCQVSAQGLIQDGRYIDSDIVDASELHLGADGIVGWCDGRAVLNHHHRLNPRLGTFKPKRLLSVGFTGHYEAMADRFGGAPIGCAAENIIVDCDRIITEADLAGVSRSARPETRRSSTSNRQRSRNHASRSPSIS